MDYSKDISDIIRALTESGFEDAEIRLDDLYIRVSSGASNQNAATYSPAMPDRVSAAENPNDGTRLGSDAAPAAVDAGGILKDIKSPTLGTFYRAPSPGALPFVRVGDRVAAGQALGLVEVMKLFNTIEAETAGTVAAIHAEDGMLVEYDQVLMTISVG